MKKRVQWLFNYKGPFCISEKNKDVNEKSLENIYIYIHLYFSSNITQNQDKMTGQRRKWNKWQIFIRKEWLNLNKLKENKN